MTARFLALYETPTDRGAFDQHYREVHIPLLRRLRGLRRYSVSRDLTALHGAPYYLVTGPGAQNDLHRRRRRNVGTASASLPEALPLSRRTELPNRSCPARDWRRYAAYTSRLLARDPPKPGHSR
jgi:hypothetical protein